jgi:hypothetical protein
MVGVLQTYRHILAFDHMCLFHITLFFLFKVPLVTHHFCITEEERRDVKKRREEKGREGRR